MFIKVLAVCLTLATYQVNATGHLVETRYTDHIERDSKGNIKRSGVVKKEFERLYPLPELVLPE